MAYDLWNNLVLFTGNAHPLALIGAYIVLHVACAILFIPCSPFALVAGAVWGIMPGLPISIAASAAAASATFWLGRWARTAGPISRFINSHCPAGARFLLREHSGMEWTTVLAVQVNPAVPASTFGYIFGGTGIRFPTFFVPSILAILPMQIVLVSTSALAIDTIATRRITVYSVVLLGICSAGIALWILARRRYSKPQEKTDIDP